ncbi:MAG: FAD-binding oxidoreductase [Pelolinea sp.]|nr:FAD-binding oxidoreductase [Pelolinea sp.]
MTKIKGFTPDWYEGETPIGTYRSLFKWHDLNAFKHPNRGFYNLLRDTFQLSDQDFKEPKLCLQQLDENIPPQIDRKHINAIEAIVGKQNIATDLYTRVRTSYGSGMVDAIRLRNHIIENINDCTAAPRNTKEIEQIVKYCDNNRIPITIFGGGSTVTRGMESTKGGVCLDMSIHMKKILSFNEENQTITVQPGIYGPELEDFLNNATEKFGAKDRYTCGHFPQSFEHSSVGGWVVTRGAGQNSTYYGKIEDLVVSQEYITPKGTFRTLDHPRAATGPDFDQIMIGSEGCFGVLTEVTLRVFKYQPENTRRFSYLFKSWEEAISAYREIMQGEFGYPSVFRLSDPEETDAAMRIYQIHDSLADSALQALGYQPMQRCLLLGSADGDRAFTRLIQHKIRRICRKHNAFNLSPFQVTRRWEYTRFTDAYMREDLLDYDIVIDTLECAVTWDQLHNVHTQVRQFIKKRPNTICMTHISHAYPQGGNLYFIFVIRYKDINDYLCLQYGILDVIQLSGAAMSHHHGIGKQTAPWLGAQIGDEWTQLMAALKKHFDPHNIMNPGGTLGLDMTEEQKNKRWGFVK